MAGYALGCDVSYHQDQNATPQKIDFVKMRRRGAVFAYIRVSVNGSMDEDFPYNWKAAADAGLLRGGFHFHEYRQGIALPSNVQAAVFSELLEPDPGELLPRDDYERPRETWPPLPPPLESHNRLRTFRTGVLQNLGINVGLYTNLDALQNVLNTARNPMPADLQYMLTNLWGAQWLRIPAGINPVDHCRTRRPSFSSWEFWQFSSKLPGREFGVESLDLDGDFFNGTEAELRAKYAPKPVETVALPTWAAALDEWARENGYRGPAPAAE